MFTVALIGADGAGKSTIANRLLESLPMRMKYIYMGLNTESSNIALPTSRLALYLKLRSYKKMAERSGNTDPGFVSTHHMAHRIDRRGKLVATVRLLNRMAEEWFRQFVAWGYLLRGYVVLYDRHFLFDTASTDPQNQRLTDRIHRWVLNHMYPQPDLVIFLDAPPEVLFSRKGETTLDYLRQKRKTFLEQGKKTANFVRIDATQHVDEVFANAAQSIMQFYMSRAHLSSRDKKKVDAETWPERAQQ